MTSGRRVIMKLLRFANKLKFSERLNKKLLHFCSSFFFFDVRTKIFHNLTESENQGMAVIVIV